MFMFLIIKILIDTDHMVLINCMSAYVCAWWGGCGMCVLLCTCVHVCGCFWFLVCLFFEAGRLQVYCHQHWPSFLSWTWLGFVYCYLTNPSFRYSNSFTQTQIVGLNLVFSNKCPFFVTFMDILESVVWIEKTCYLHVEILTFSVWSTIKWMAVH